MVCSLPFRCNLPQNLGDVLRTLGLYLLDIISPNLGYVLESSNWTVMSFLFYVALELIFIATALNIDKSLDKTIVHFSHQLSKPVCSVPCLCHLTNIEKQESGCSCKPLPLGYMSDLAYWYRKKKKKNSEPEMGLLPVGLLAHSSSQDSRNNSSFDIMNDSALA